MRLSITSPELLARNICTTRISKVTNELGVGQFINSAEHSRQWRKWEKNGNTIWRTFSNSKEKTWEGYNVAQLLTISERVGHIDGGLVQYGIWNCDFTDV